MAKGRLSFHPLNSKGQKVEIYYNKANHFLITIILYHEFRDC